MKFEAKMFGYLTAFLAAVTVAYWYLSRDPAGTTALALSTSLGALIALYLIATARRIGERPEDREDAEIAEGAGELGFFPPYSWWPLVVALSGTVSVLGLIFGWWLFFLSMPLALFAVMGFVFEYYHGENQRH
ncbi:MAG: cytochrome c oxidase subunit 4 [Carbonactinosporaceae bacterium]